MPVLGGAMGSERDLSWVSLGPHISYDAKMDWSTYLRLTVLSFLSPGWAPITKALSTCVTVVITGF